MTIRVENLSFGYGTASVLDRVSLEIEPGRFTVILGRNGSGKSTLFKVLAGAARPCRGRVFLAGRPSDALSARQRSGILGYLPQFIRPVFPFRAADVVLTGCAGRVRFSPGKEDTERAKKAMDRVGISHLADRAFTELSGGEQQMVMIARVLVQDPQIILLDEPTAHLDFHFQARVLALVRRLTDQGRTIVSVLHDPNIAARYGQRFICLENGRTRYFKRFPDHQVLERVFNMPLTHIPHPGNPMVMPA